MTNNNNTKPNNCACEKMTCESFVAGNQCFRCEQVDNRHAGITFADEYSEQATWFRQITRRIVDHKAGPNYIDPARYADDTPKDDPKLSVHEAVDLYW